MDVITSTGSKINIKGEVHKVHLSRPMYEEISLKISNDHPGTAVGKK